MFMKVHRGASSAHSRARTIEKLEARQLMAAHILGSPVIYSTIQAAVDAAAPGATIKVDPGTYHESVKITTPLTLQGAPFLQTIVDGAAFTAGGVTTHTTSFTISANDVKLDGFTIQNNTDAVHGAGIVIAPNIAGTKIFNNNINHNVTGLYLASSSNTDPAIIRNNIFAYNNNPGDNPGRGIYTNGGVSGGMLTNVTIDQNLFVGNVGVTPNSNPEAAIGLETQAAGEQANIRITNNLMVANGKGVLLYNATGVTIANNIMTGCTDSASAAVRDEGNVSNLAITGNSFLFNGGAAIMIDQKVATIPSSNISVNDNNFLGNAKGALVIAAGGYTGTLDATHNWWGSFFGPSSSGHDALITNGNAVLSSPFSRFPIF
jgi:parallel beta-helix repeat protein